MTCRKDYLDADIRNAAKNCWRHERYAATKQEKSKHIAPAICQVAVNTIRFSPDVVTSMEADVQNNCFKTSSAFLVNNPRQICRKISALGDYKERSTLSASNLSTSICNSKNFNVFVLYIIKIHNR